MRVVEGMGETFEFNKVVLKLERMFSTFFAYSSRDKKFTVLFWMPFYV